ncbi:MAG: Gfo/Idh/MocA family oxidoreductase [Thermomicrobiales bacterium]|nr:Gfo/Idh/MocA family oxidoreductase [Thermomicrobiales bacterium]
MGRHHVRVYGELSDVELVGIVDVSRAAAERVAKGRNIEPFTDIEEMLVKARPDIVSIAVPTSLHHDVALRAIEFGADILVEKPIARTIEEAQSLANAAERAGVRLMIGHIERFNPAVRELKRRIEQAGTIFQTMARRVGPFPDRIRDVGVVVDLAAHDIDAMRFLLNLPAERIYAETARRIHTDYEDMLFGTIRFANGVVGCLEVNWLTPTKIRELSVVGSRGTFIANYLTQELSFHENSAVSNEWVDFSSLQGVSEGNASRYSFPRQEPLRAELEAFVAYARGGECPVLPADATDTLAIALDLIHSAEVGMPVHHVDHCRPNLARAS